MLRNPTPEQPFPGPPHVHTVLYKAFRSNRFKMFLAACKSCLSKVLNTVVMVLLGNKEIRRREKYYIPYGSYPVPRGTKILFEDKDFHVQIYSSVHW